MIIQPFSDEISRLIDDYQNRYGVLMFQKIGLAYEFPLHKSTHRSAARLTIEEIIRTCPGARDDKIDPDKEIWGARISIPNFVGLRFDILRRKALLRGEKEEFRNHLFYTGDEEIADNAFRVTVDGGLSYAFFETPYGLKGPKHEHESLFIRLADELFRGFREDMIIYEWATDWSTFFDLGHEWWGAFLWTVHVVGTDHIIGVTASASD